MADSGRVSSICSMIILFLIDNFEFPQQQNIPITESLSTFYWQNQNKTLFELGSEDSSIIDTKGRIMCNRLSDQKCVGNK